MVKEIAEELSEDEKRALRGSKFAPLPSLPPPRSQPRLAHPGGPLTTNKAAALAKFLERKLQDPNGLSSINPNLVERAVQDAKRTVFTSGAASNSGVIIKHVNSFGDSDSEDLPQQEENVTNSEPKKLKKRNKQKKKKSEKKRKQQKILENSGCAVVKKPKKKVKIVV